MNRLLGRATLLRSRTVFTLALSTLGLLWTAHAQVTTGSNGSDGAFNPTAANTVINMATHPDGIYQYTSVNIPKGVRVTFTPNANNTPVTWLVQGDVIISGSVDVSGQGSGLGNVPGQGGPGGGSGGYGGQGAAPLPQRGGGLGGGEAGAINTPVGGRGSYATSGVQGTPTAPEALPGLTYGNKYLLPLLGGSGGGGAYLGPGGGGGGGAILIASDTSIRIDGGVGAYGCNGASNGAQHSSGYGSGGGIRLVAPRIAGSGYVEAAGSGTGYLGISGDGFVRLDAPDDEFTGTLAGSASRGFNPVLVAPANQNVRLAIQSIGGNAVPSNPTGALATPDVAVPAQQATPIPVVVSCVNLPLNTPITVVVKPVSGPMTLVSAVNNTGTLASSTATVSIVIPRGGGLIYATAATGN